MHLNRFFILLLFVFTSITVFSQKNETKTKYSVDVNYAKGHIFLHHKKVIPLERNNPKNIIVSWNKHTFGQKEWERVFNNPSYGVSFVYQDFNSDFLGKSYGIYFNYTTYLYKRKLLIQLADGISYMTRPYDKVNNNKNIYIGSKVLNGFYLSFRYQEPNLFRGFGLQTGILFSHNSNAKIKMPNLGINSILFQLGVNYSFGEKENRLPYYEPEISFEKRIQYNFEVKGGVNELVEGVGIKPFYVLSLYGSKRFNRKNGMTFGGEYFASNGFREWVKYRKFFDYPNMKGYPDYRRVGIFIGHEFYINKTSFFTQFGYYVYNKLKNKDILYERIGFRYQFHKNIFATVGLKVFIVNAEQLEFGLGVKL